MQGMTRFVDSLGFPLPALFAWAAKLSEFVGGICLILGALTRPAALFIAVTMGVAAFIAHASDPWLLLAPATKAKEMALLYFAAALTLLCTGPGPVAMDTWLSRKLPRFLGGRKD